MVACRQATPGELLSSHEQASTSEIVSEDPWEHRRMAVLQALSHHGPREVGCWICAGAPEWHICGSDFWEFSVDQFVPLRCSASPVYRLLEFAEHAPQWSSFLA